MSRFRLTSFALLAVFCVPGMMPTATGAEPARPNQVFVKIIWPTDPQPVLQVESWIATKLKNLGRAKFAAATPWVAVVGQKNHRTVVWDGMLGDDQCGCPVVAEIVERDKGRVKVRLTGWSPAGGRVVVALRDEPGCRKVASAEHATAKAEEGRAYAAVLVGPPPKAVDVALLTDSVSATLNRSLVIDLKSDGKRLRPNRLDEPEANANTVRIKLAETMDSPVPPPRDGAKRPYLSIENRYGKTLRFRAAARLKGSKEFIEIDALGPVLAGETFNKCWGFDDLVEEVVVYDFSLLDKPAK